ncbi:unnamed protein product [Chrysoparadoxa australica]
MASEPAPESEERWKLKISKQKGFNIAKFGQSYYTPKHGGKPEPMHVPLFEEPSVCTPPVYMWKEQEAEEYSGDEGEEGKKEKEKGTYDRFNQPSALMKRLQRSGSRHRPANWVIEDGKEFEKGGMRFVGSSDAPGSKYVLLEVQDSDQNEIKVIPVGEWWHFERPVRDASSKLDIKNAMHLMRQRQLGYDISAADEDSEAAAKIKNRGLDARLRQIADRNGGELADEAVLPGGGAKGAKAPKSRKPKGKAAKEEALAEEAAGKKSKGSDSESGDDDKGVDFEQVFSDDEDAGDLEKDSKFDYDSSSGEGSGAEPEPVGQSVNSLMRNLKTKGDEGEGGEVDDEELDDFAGQSTFVQVHGLAGAEADSDKLEAAAAVTPVKDAGGSSPVATPVEGLTPQAAAASASTAAAAGSSKKRTMDEEDSGVSRDAKRLRADAVITEEMIIEEMRKVGGHMTRKALLTAFKRQLKASDSNREIFKQLVRKLVNSVEDAYDGKVYKLKDRFTGI